MAENKTKATDASVEKYLAERANPQQLADARALMKMFKRITGKPPRMWGPSIVGHGSLRYTYESGRSGEMPMAAFAVRGKDLVVYLSCEHAPQQALLAKAGKHRMGKPCFYFRQLADLDVQVLEKLVAGSIEEARARQA